MSGRLGLSTAEIIAAIHSLIWLRPEQRIGRGRWRYWGFICGRGFGKSHAIALEITRRVMAGEVRRIGLMAPTLPRVNEVQITMLIDVAPPWFKPKEYKDGIVWPNGARGIAFTAENEHSRGDNLELSWLTEIVDWPASTRSDAFNAITTATREGPCPQVLWDTTSKGKNEVILHLLAQHERDPERYPIVRGTMLDNYYLSDDYIRDEIAKYPPGRRRDEEVFGKVFAESAGALWRQEWIDRHRVIVAPGRFAVRVVGVDPAISTRADADPTGIVVVDLHASGHLYVAEDLSGKLTPEQWADAVIGQCVHAGASGAVLERNRGGDLNVSLLRARCMAEEWRALRLVVRPVPDEAPFPPATPGVIYVRQVTARDAKDVRAQGPAALQEQGLTHHVGTLTELEYELTTHEPGSPQSPNRYDAYVHAVLELSGTLREAKPDTSRDVAAAAVVNEALRRGLAGVAGRRGVGL
jgi:phage terminase large subunit-like protein